MAKKTETKDLLTGKQKPQGWRDQFTDGQEQSEPAPARTQKSSGAYKRKTYLMTDELIQRIEVQAEKAGVGINEMNRYLLTVALDQVERDEHAVQVQIVSKRTLGV